MTGRLVSGGSGGISMDNGKGKFYLILLWLLPLMVSLTYCGAGGGGGESGPSSSVNAAGTTKGVVSGIVVDKSGVPISGVTITAYHTNNNIGVTTTTDANGAY